MFDVCIVGAGLIGTAAARHASLVTGKSVCLIGPTEPKERTSSNGRDIYGAWYDEGRITRCCDPDPVWAKLAVESINRYREIEKLAGIKFYHENGNLMVGSGKDSKFISNIKDAAKACNVNMQQINCEGLQNNWPFLNFMKDAQAVLETNNAGFINPRKLVEAQKVIASQQGCTLFDDVVHQVDRIVQPDGTYVMKVSTESGRVCLAKSVLLTTGAFTRFRNLLPRGIGVRHVISTIAVALLEVEVEKMDTSLKDMPCLLYKGRGFEEWRVPDLYKNHDDIYFYMLPPIQYPNGRYYIKLGFINPECQTAETSAELKRWYDEGDNAFQESIANFTQSLFKGTKFVSWKGDSCAIMDTPTSHPYIDHIHDQLGVAVGGNGYAAKSSDEIGRLGANMIMNRWNSSLNQDLFKIIYTTNSKL